MNKSPFTQPATHCRVNGGLHCYARRRKTRNSSVTWFEPRYLPSPTCHYFYVNNLLSPSRTSPYDSRTSPCDTQQAVHHPTIVGTPYRGLTPDDASCSARSSPSRPARGRDTRESGEPPSPPTRVSSLPPVAATTRLSCPSFALASSSTILQTWPRRSVPSLKPGGVLDCHTPSIRCKQSSVGPGLMHGHNNALYVVHRSNTWQKKA